jgi:hypothetical protein
MGRWRKSSHSQGGQGECIEIAGGAADSILMRDSKHPEGPLLVVRRTELARLIDRIQTGTYDL